MSIILDFDGTITERDTLNVLTGYFIGQSSEKQTLWTSIVRQYEEDLRLFKQSYHPAEDVRIDLEAELSYLQEQRKIDTSSTDRINQSCLFQIEEKDNIPQEQRQELYEFGQRAVELGLVKIRAGFHDFLKTMLETDWKLGVLSLNWSTDFVKGVLGTVDPRAPHAIKYCTNDIRYPDGKIIGPTSGHKPMLASADKVACWTALFPDMPMQEAIMVGDSGGDLEPMARAKKAVAISHNREASYPCRALQRIGHVVDHISVLNPGWRFCRTEDFHELTRLLGSGPKAIL